MRELRGGLSGGGGKWRRWADGGGGVVAKAVAGGSASGFWRRCMAWQTTVDLVLTENREWRTRGSSWLSMRAWKAVSSAVGASLAGCDAARER